MQVQPTQPLPLDALAAEHGSLDEFRVSSAREVIAILKQFLDGNLSLSLHGGNGALLATTLWSLDPDRGQMSFTADADAPTTQLLVAADEVVAVGYLDSIKVQFELQDIMLVRGLTGSTLSARMPVVLYRFQRRNTFRVRPLLRSSPVARLRHPALPDMQLALRIIDVSIGGCALFLPEGVPPMQPGMISQEAQIDLDGETRLHTRLRLQHITTLNPDSRGSRLGCGFVGLGHDAERNLQRFIDQTQKRRRLMSLD